MSFTMPKPAYSAPTAAAAPQPVISKGLKIATIIFTALAGVGLIVTLSLLLATATNTTNEEFGWYFGFSVTVSVVNMISAVVALILGIVGRRSQGRVSLTAIILGTVVLLVLAGQVVFLLVA